MTQQIDIYRLPRHTLPSRYELVLEPDLANATFAGQVRISVSTTEPADQFVLNAVELDIGDVHVDGVAVPFSVDDATERIVIDTAAHIGDHEIVIGFTGTLNDKLRGWYRSTYIDAAGDQQVIATTQMQATDCRRAFPCFDEPDMKAVFAVSLVVDPGHLAVSNSPESSRERRDDGKDIVRFADTMVLSTYLVAFVVGPLAATEPIDVNGTPMRIVHVPGKEALTGFGLEVGAFALAWFEQYYAIRYPGEKIDMIALPDFAAGAMENLGCVTFRENLLLVDPDNSTQAERQVVTDVVAHELAHMWFGDLVTMSWWNGIWLNEAFATFMEVAACDAFRPEWERWTSFSLERSAAFDVDSLASTRSVEYEVHAPSDCEGMFDVLTYQKGGALLRMLEQHIGPEAFRDGVRHYLTTHAYANTETVDLWDALETTSGQPVRQLMDSWIWQPGYPLLDAAIDGDQVTLTQARFSFGTDSATDSTWMVPVTVAHGGTVTRMVLSDQPQQMTVGADPVIVNAGGHGFFRVAYDDELLERFTPDVLAGMDTLERAGLVDDTWNGVLAGNYSPTDFLTLATRFTDETELQVWQYILGGLEHTRRLINDRSDARDALTERTAALVKPTLERLGDPVPGESDLTAKLRALLFSTAALHGGDSSRVEQARAIYAAWQADGDGDPELVAAATTVVAATGDVNMYEHFLTQCSAAPTPQLQLRHLYRLADFADEDLMRRTCALAFSSQVKSQNAPFLLRAAIANPDHGALAWDLLKQGWSQAEREFPQSAMAPMLGTLPRLDTADLAADVASFLADHPIGQAVLQVAQILERQAVCTALRTRVAGEVADWLTTS